MPTIGMQRAPILEGGAASGAGRFVLSFVVLIFLAILLFASAASVPAGHVGVLTLFGRVTGEVLPEGIHMVNPFKANHVMSVRTQSQKETARVPSQEGLEIALDTSLIFLFQAQKEAAVYHHIGLDYVHTFIDPHL